MTQYLLAGSASALSDLYIDAVVVDGCGQLLFLSAWGNQSHIQQTRARVSLSKGANALDHFVFTKAFPLDHTSFPDFPRFVFLNKKSRLKEAMGRSGKTIFSHLTQWWLYDRLAVSPDEANGRALLLRRHSEDEKKFHHRIWRTVEKLSHTPMYALWMGDMLPVFKEKGWIKIHCGFGIDACSIALPQADISEWIENAIKAGHLVLPTTH